MTKHSYTLNIPGENEGEAERKAKALSTLATKLDEKTLTKLAHVVANEPTKVILAKKFLGI